METNSFGNVIKPDIKIIFPFNFIVMIDNLTQNFRYDNLFLPVSSDSREVVSMFMYKKISPMNVRMQSKR
jgi:hypothetical protein